MVEQEGSAFERRADRVLLATGFVSPVPERLLAGLGVALDKRGNVVADPKGYASSAPKI